MEKYNTSEIPKSSRITRLVDHLYAKMPEIESYRAKLITESYKETEDQPIITRRAKAFSHILHNIPIIIRDEELLFHFFPAALLALLKGQLLLMGQGTAAGPCLGHGCFLLSLRIKSRSYRFTDSGPGCRNTPAGRTLP